MRRTARTTIIATFVLLGALVGSIVGFWAGLAVVNDEAAGWMTRSATVAGLVGGSVGLLIGSILGGTASWALVRWREREQHRTHSSLP